ncbi:hypothetical protein P7K49_027107 [Saguinus oedipus]|uniref:Uncharacterized protein n=1 Tax=Saguinus oedipus TaxID=9490 RepID=A0ABQ9UFM2_SAGOE|nr:hypothetical protein P7K49_027107 [Saguinus oedipus]
MSFITESFFLRFANKKSMAQSQWEYIQGSLYVRGIVIRVLLSSELDGFSDLLCTLCSPAVSPTQSTHHHHCNSNTSRGACNPLQSAIHCSSNAFQRLLFEHAIHAFDTEPNSTFAFSILSHPVSPPSL